MRVSRTGALRSLPAAIALAVIGAVLVTVQTPATAQQTAPGGTSSADAAASCWEIKQNNPAAGNGVYWLQTPALVAPERFYCDMTTDGGGWVLIARGRQDWRQEYQGQGSPGQVRDPITGPAAFTVRSLPSTTVDALLNNGRVDALQDGMRLRRATNTAGTSWQEARIHFADRDRWVWSFGADHRLGTWTIGSANGSGGLSNNFGTNNAFNRVDFRHNHSGQGWLRGWSFGRSVTGTNSSTSYLWSSTNGAGSARPFTQVFLRPKLRSTDLDYPAVPDAGTPKSELTPLLQSGAEPQQWGVTGRINDNPGEHYTEAQAITQVGDTVFVGGSFQYVQKGQNPAPGEKVAQRFLAGFDVHTGEWVSSFRPTFDGQVKALAATPDGKLIAGGEFTKVNGTDAVGVVALDPATGAVDPSWRVAMENRLTCCPVRVWNMHVAGDWLYLVGAFTHLKGGTQSEPAFARNAARVRLSDGFADRHWNPNFNGTAYDLDISADGQRFYAAGYMTYSGDTETERVAILSTVNGAGVVPGMRDPVFSHSTNYQHTIVEAGDRVWVGGSQHSMFSYAVSDFRSLSGNITKQGGDLQSARAYDGVVYGSCHCQDWNYSDTFTYPNVGSQWTQADTISFIGAWDQETGDYLPEFNPWLRATHDQGPWGSFQDSTGVVWFAGDISQARRTDGRFQWVGGFVRFAPRDITAPTAPKNLTSTDQGNGTAKLTWTGATDDRGSVAYEVLRGDRVIATTRWKSMVVPIPSAGPQRYFVRAVDPATNRSASTPVHVLAPA